MPCATTSAVWSAVVCASSAVFLVCVWLFSRGLKHAEGAKELWQRSWNAFHRWLHLVQAGMALTIMLSLRDDPDIVRLAHAGGWRCEIHPTAGMIKDGLIRRFRNCRVDGLFARKGRKSGLVLAARPSAAAMAA